MIYILILIGAVIGRLDLVRYLEYLLIISLIIPAFKYYRYKKEPNYYEYDGVRDFGSFFKHFISYFFISVMIYIAILVFLMCCGYEYQMTHGGIWTHDSHGNLIHYYR